MPRPFQAVFVSCALLGLGVGGYLAWSGYAEKRDWQELRPNLPAKAGETAPGLDARLEKCAAALADWPPDRAAWEEFSLLCHANGLLPEAIAGYRALAMIEPAQGRWPHLLAGILAGLGRLDEALPLMERVTKLAPDETIGWLRLGDARLKINLTAEAETAYQEVLRRNPGDVFALFGLARCDLQAGRLTGARSRLQQATQADPDFPGAQSLLAMVFDQLGNPEAAATARSRVKGDGRYMAAPDPWALDLVAYGHNPYMLLTAASAYSSDGSPKLALPLLKRALQLAPNDARLHRQLGNTLARLGDPAGARTELEQALALAPTDEKIRTDLIKVLREAQDFARLGQVVAEGTRTNPDSDSLHFEAGLMAVRAGRPEEAIGHFSTVWKLRPEETAAPCELAAVYFGSGRQAEGERVLETLRQSHPDDTAVLTLLVRHGIIAGDPRTSGWWQRLEALSPPSPQLAELRRAYLRRFSPTP